MKSHFFSVRTLLLAIILLSVVLQPVSAFPIPVTPGASTTTSISNNTNLSLTGFVSNSSNGNASQLVGIYAASIFALPVVQQPQDNPGYVSTEDGKLTQFRMAEQFKTIGILAHNHLAGLNFFSLQTGQFLTLVYGDGSLAMYKISAVRDFQALSPNSPYSNFVDLSDPSAVLTATDLFMQTYGVGNMVVLQTCIAKDGEPSWGRRIILAEPVTLRSNQIALK